VRVIRRITRLAAIERAKPRDDRRYFIVACDAYGHVTVTYYDHEDDYRAAYNTDPSDYVWRAGYDKWLDQRR